MNCRAIAYEGNQPYVFLSYSPDDREMLLPFFELLAKYRIRFWYDNGQLPQQERESITNQRYSMASSVLALVSENSSCEHGFRRLITDTIQNGQPILPLIVYDFPMPRGFRLQLEAQDPLVAETFVSLDALTAELSRDPRITGCKLEEHEESLLLPVPEEEDSWEYLIPLEQLLQEKQEAEAPCEEPKVTVPLVDWEEDYPVSDCLALPEENEPEVTVSRVNWDDEFPVSDCLALPEEKEPEVTVSRVSWDDEFPVSDCLALPEENEPEVTVSRVSWDDEFPVSDCLALPEENETVFRLSTDFGESFVPELELDEEDLKLLQPKPMDWNMPLSEFIPDPAEMYEKEKNEEDTSMPKEKEHTIKSESAPDGGYPWTWEDSQEPAAPVQKEADSNDGSFSFTDFVKEITNTKAKNPGQDNPAPSLWDFIPELDPPSIQTITTDDLMPKKKQPDKITALLVQPSAKTVHLIRGNRATIGRNCDFSRVVLEGNRNVSKHHATYSISNGTVYLEPVSDKGTYCNGIKLEPMRIQQITTPAALRFADEDLVLITGELMETLLEKGTVSFLYNEHKTAVQILEGDLMHLDRSHVWADGKTLADPSIHRTAHAQLRQRKSGVFLSNVGPAKGNPPLRNGRPLRAVETVPVENGDLIQLGNTVMHFISIKIQGVGK